MRNRPRRTRNQRGATAVEHALLIAGIAAVVVLTVFALGRLVPGLLDVAWPGA